jgi:hypothetical protein
MEVLPDADEVRPAQSVVRIASESYKLGCMWIFRSLDHPKNPPLRALIYHQGMDFLVLEPGAYEVTLNAGLADDIVIALKPRRVELRKGYVYRSEFDLNVEDLVAKRIKTQRDAEAKEDESDAP